MQGDGTIQRVHAGRLVLRIILGGGGGAVGGAAAALAWPRYPIDILEIDIVWVVAMTACYVPLTLATLVGAIRWAGGWNTTPRRAVEILTCGAALGAASTGALAALAASAPDAYLATGTDPFGANLACRACV